ncbi:MAG: N-acetylmuramoyl-L-alanine amidase [Solirubrobacterales bacterium]|nr:N-acetylmuramoyl-L-alanine amidase [Solirubrobacterales bacterium]
MSASVETRWVGELTPRGAELTAAGPFVLAGIEWAGPATPRVELRAKGPDGSWTRWALASTQGHDGEGPAHARFGEPVWTGPAVALALRSDRPVSGLSVHLVDAPEGPRVISDAARATLSSVQLPAGAGQPPIIARKAWAGSQDPPGAMPAYGNVALAFVHHSENANGYSAAQVPGMLSAIYKFHRYARGWHDIGYNFLIDNFGRIWEGRAGGIDQAVMGAQAGAYNLESTGVAMLGSYGSVLPSSAALNALARLLAWKLPLHGVPVTGTTVVEVQPGDAGYTPFKPRQRVRLKRISGHRDGDSTDCPGAALYAHLPKLRSDTAGLLAKAGPQPLLRLGFLPGPGVKLTGPTDLAADTAEIHAGTPVALHGVLTQLNGDGSPGAPIPGVSVALQSVVGSAGNDVPVSVTPPGAQPTSVLSTGADGSFQASLSTNSNLLVRALRSDSPAVASALVVIAVTPSVTLTRAPGPAVSVAGTVSANKPKVLIEVWKYGAKTPKLVQHHTVAVHNGSFGARLKLGRGSYALRATTPADSHNAAGVSPRLTLSV